MATQDISQLVVEVQSKGIQTAANQLDKLAVASDKAEAAVKRLGTSVVGVNGVLTGGVAQTAALVAAMTTLTAVLERTSQSQNRATVSTRANNEAMAEAHALARGLSGSLGALWVTYGNLAGMGVGIAIGASLKGVVSVGKDVENTLESIRVLGGATTEDVAKMSATISDLGKGTQGPKDVAEALQVLTMAGLTAKEAISGVGAALNLSVAGGVGIEKSAETLVQVGTALGYTADGYDHVADVIAKAAAVSMSSVDSISGAFKSAAAVGEVYGASLQDIATGLAAVANLGIQGTAAGTALKNFYKDLSASTDKVTKTLGAMGLSIDSFRDKTTGGFIPLLEVVGKLDAGLSKLTPKARAMAEVKIFGQQGVREGAILLQMLHQTSDLLDANGNKYANKLEEVRGEIQKSEAFSTLAAIAMAQTTSNQFKSVGNTLQTVFAEVFKTVQPQIGEIARSLKAAFASPEFKSGLSTTIEVISSFTKAIVDNIGTLKVLAGVIIGLKMVSFANDIRLAAQAFEITAISVRGVLAALGPIAIAIGALTLAWQTYKEYKDRALNNTPASNNLQEYADNVKKAAEKEKAIEEMRKKGASELEVQRSQQIAQDVEASDAAIAASKKGTGVMLADLQSQYNALSKNQKLRADMIVTGKTEFGDTPTVKYVESLQAYNKAMATQATQIAEVTKNQKELQAARRSNQAFDDAAAAKRRFISPGDGELPGKGDKAAENARYAAAIQDFQNDIKGAYRDLNNFRDTEDAKFRTGEVGRLQVISDTAAKEIETYKLVAEKATAQRDLAAKTANKEPDVERFQGEIDKANDAKAHAEKMRDADTLVAKRAMLAQSVQLRVKALEDEGKFVEAANERWSSEGKIQWEQAKADAKVFGDTFPELTKLVDAFYAAHLAAVSSAEIKEAYAQFNIEALKLEGTLKGFKTATEGRSIGTMFDSATEASAAFTVQLKKAQAEQKKLADIAAKAKTPEAEKDLAEANNKIKSLTDKQKSMWMEVGQTITSSLKDAFGSAGEALGKLNEAMLDYKNTEDASAEDRMKQYGDMAQAASGFFDKQSKGYRALNGIAQVFHIAQMARTIAQTAASVIAGAANFFAQSGWGGFAGVAAMGAVLGGLGWAMSGASAHGADPKLNSDYVQKHQGTGTVFGDADAKSKSISESISLLKNNSDIMLPLTQGMLASLQNIETSMKGLAGMAVRGGINDASNMNIKTGNMGNGLNPILATLMGVNAVGGAASGAMMGAMFGPIGMAAGALLGAIGGKLLGKLWGSTSQSIIDSGLQFGGKVSDLKNGQGINQYAAVKTDSSSWFGLSKSSSTNVQTQGVSGDMSRQFGLVFSNLEDALKGAASTLGANSDAVGSAIENLVLDTAKISLKDLKGQELTDAINNVMSGAMDQIATAAYPQMKAFQQVGEGYAQTVLRVATGVEKANSVLDKFGIKGVNYADVVNKQGDVAFEIAKQSILATEGLSGVGDMLKNMTGSVDELATAYKALTDIRAQMKAVGLGGNLTLGMLKGAGGVQQMQTAMNAYQDKYFTDQEKAAIMLKSVTAEFKKLGVALPTSKAALRDLIETSSKSNPELTGQLLSLADAYAKTVDSANTARKEQTDTWQTTIDGLKKFADALKSFKDSLALGDLSILTPDEKYIEAKKQYEDTVAKALNGDATAQDAYTGVAQAYLDASRTVNASSQGYTDSYNAVMADMDKLSSSTATQLSNAEQQLKAMQDQVDSLAALNTTAEGIKASIDGLATSMAPATAAPVVVDTAALEDQIVQLRQQLADAQAANAKQMADLMAVVYDAQTNGAKVIAGAVTDSVKETAWADKTSKTLTIER